jgi:hypothetical protein
MTHLTLHCQGGRMASFIVMIVGTAIIMQKIRTYIYDFTNNHEPEPPIRSRD